MEPDNSVPLATLTRTLSPDDTGDLALNIETPDDDNTAYITRLGMLEMAKTMINELE